MGKIRKKRQAKPAASTQDAEVESEAVQKNAFLPPAIMEALPKDFDLASVRSFKSMKNKFGIKKQITKVQKQKLRKEILKQKIDIIKEASEDKLSKNQSKKLKKVLKKNKTSSRPLAASSNGFPNCESEIGAILKFNHIKDEDEEYMKLGSKKIKGVVKKKQRRNQMVKDISSLKHLMAKAKPKT